MSSCLRRLAVLALVTLTSVCAGVCAPVRAWETETAHRGLATAAEVAAREIAALTASCIREKLLRGWTVASGRPNYAYAHDGIRLSQTRDATGANPVTTHYLIDPNTAYAQVIEEAEQQGSGALTVKALYAVGDDRIRRYTPAVAGSGGNPGIPAGLRYYHADGLGSTRLLTDEAGAVTDKTTFEAFGEIDTAASQQTSDNSFLYTGEQLDPNTGFIYLRARYMNPGSGRFTQQDSFEGRKKKPKTLNSIVMVMVTP